MNFLKRSMAVGILAATTGLVGCASMPDNLVTGDAVNVVKTDSRSAHVSSVQVNVIDEQHIRVSGYLTKGYQQRGAIPGRLYIQAVADDGEVIADVVSDYHRRRAHSKHSFFSQAIELPVGRLDVVKVTHHGLGTGEH
jgi:hypothetical protein